MACSQSCYGAGVIMWFGLSGLQVSLGKGWVLSVWASRATGLQSSDVMSSAFWALVIEVGFWDFVARYHVYGL